MTTETDTPYTRALGLAVSMCNRLNADLHRQRITNPLWTPQNKTVYTPGREGLVGSRTPEVFDSIPEDKQMADSVCSFNGSQWVPDALERPEYLVYFTAIAAQEAWSGFVLKEYLEDWRRIFSLGLQWLADPVANRRWGGIVIWDFQANSFLDIRKISPPASFWASIGLSGETQFKDDHIPFYPGYRVTEAHGFETGRPRDVLKDTPPVIGFSLLAFLCSEYCEVSGEDELLFEPQTWNPELNNLGYFRDAREDVDNSTWTSTILTLGDGVRQVRFEGSSLIDSKRYSIDVSPYSAFILANTSHGYPEGYLAAFYSLEKISTGSDLNDLSWVGTPQALEGWSGYCEYVDSAASAFGTFNTQSHTVYNTSFGMSFATMRYLEAGSHPSYPPLPPEHLYSLSPGVGLNLVSDHTTSGARYYYGNPHNFSSHPAGFCFFWGFPAFGDAPRPGDGPAAGYQNSTSEYTGSRFFGAEYVLSPFSLWHSSNKRRIFIHGIVGGEFYTKNFGVWQDGEVFDSGLKVDLRTGKQGQDLFTSEDSTGLGLSEMFTQLLQFEHQHLQEVLFSASNPRPLFGSGSGFPCFGLLGFIKLGYIGDAQ